MAATRRARVRTGSTLPERWGLSRRRPRTLRRQEPPPTPLRPHWVGRRRRLGLRTPLRRRAPAAAARWLSWWLRNSDTLWRSLQRTCCDLRRCCTRRRRGTRRKRMRQARQVELFWQMTSSSEPHLSHRSGWGPAPQVPLASAAHATASQTYTPPRRERFPADWGRGSADLLRSGYDESGVKLGCRDGRGNAGMRLEGGRPLREPQDRLRQAPSSGSGRSQGEREMERVIRRLPVRPSQPSLDSGFRRKDEGGATSAGGTLR